MTVGQALWPGLLSNEERAWLEPGRPPSLPRRPDVLIVGGGILGIATAAACARAGFGSVVVLERDRLGAGASGGAAGLLMPDGHVGVDPPFMVDFARSSLTAWRELEQTWPGGVGLADMDWLGFDDDTAAQFGADLPPTTRRLTTEQVSQMIPGLAQPSAGVFAPRKARVNPLRAIARLAAGLPYVATGVEVQAVSVEHGRVKSVTSTAGEFQPGAVVFATGTGPRISGLEVNIPSDEVKGHILATEQTGLRLPGAVASLAATLDDGRLLVGGTLDVGDDERVVRPEVIASMWAEVERAWPSARGIRISHQWACFRPAHPDHLPVIDAIPSLGNAWVTSGHYKTGILMAPATGRVLAEWIRSGQRPAAVDGFGLARFG
jgi:glycine/D-amino acid oxidase-like deaminating enzyme